MIEIGHGGHLHPGIGQVEGDGVAVRICGCHHRARARLDAVKSHHALRRRAEDDARQIVVAEDDRLLDRAGGRHHGLRAQLEEAVVLDDGEPVVGKPAAASRPAEHAHLLVLGQFGAQSRGFARAVVDAAPVEPATDHRLLVYQHNLRTLARGLQRSGQTGRAAADHSHIGEEVGLVVILVVVVLVNSPQAGLGADHLFPELPCAFRLVEGLVIEADRHEAAEMFEHCVAVAVQRSADVERGGGEPLLDRHAVGQRVRMRADLHVCIGVQARHGQPATRPVILERPAHHVLAVGDQCACQRVAGQTGVVPSFEAEGDLRLAVDQKTPGCGQAFGSAHALSSPKVFFSVNSSRAG